MYIKTTKENIYPDEPAVGSMTESELIADAEEVIEVLITVMAASQECPDIFTAIDDYTDEDIELETSNYLTSEQIDMLNDMFMVDNEWTETQLAYILEKEVR